MGVYYIGALLKEHHYDVEILNFHNIRSPQAIQDIPILTYHYIVSICNELKIPIKSISEDFTEYLISYTWFGNVRELINTLNATTT